MISNAIGIAYEWDKICCKLNPSREHERTTAICPECHKRREITNFTKIGVCKPCAKVMVSRRKETYIQAKIKMRKK